MLNTEHKGRIVPLPHHCPFGVTDTIAYENTKYRKTNGSDPKPVGKLSVVSGSVMMTAHVEQITHGSLTER